MTKKPLYRPCVGVALFNAQGCVFIGRRNKKMSAEAISDHEWQMPQGGVDENEEPQMAALRELWEETNVRSVAFLAEAPDWLSYDLPEDIAKKSWGGRYRGQTQKWFAYRFTGQESEIDVHDPGPGCKPEFNAWRWERLESLPDLVIPFKRAVYEKVVAFFAPIAAQK